MPLFTYKAIDAAGKSAVGQIQASNMIDLEMRLKRMGLDMINGGPTRRGAALMRKGSIKREDLINFCFHLENLLRAGVPLIESLTDLRDTSENPRFREVISGITESIQGGSSLSAALADYPDIFSPVFASLIKAGEATGRMPDVLLNLTDTLKWEDELAAQTKKIVMLPAFVGSIVLLVTFFLMIYLVPQMVAFIKGMGSTDCRIATLRGILVGHDRAANRAGVCGESGGGKKPDCSLQTGQAQTQCAADGQHPAKNHPFALCQHLCADVFGRHYHHGCHAQF
jgi:type IV pilus assembly protein PilC